MGFTAKASRCLKKIIALKDDETNEILDRFGKVKASNPSISDDVALSQAVKAMLSDLKGVGTPVQGTAVSDMAAELTGAQTPRSTAAKAVVRQAADEFIAKIDAAKAAGEITAGDEERLMNMALEGERGRVKAKDELMRLQEVHAERKVGRDEAAKLWEDPDWMHQEGDPKFADLSPASQDKWTKAARAEKTTIELYDQLVAEQKVVEGMPKVEGDTLANPAREVTNPDSGETTVDHTLKEMQMGHTAIAWLAENATDDWVRAIAAKVAPFIPNNVPIHWLVPGQSYTLPASVSRLVKAGSIAVATSTAAGEQSVYALSAVEGKPMSQVSILHELIHIATQKALHGTAQPALRGELESIASAVRTALTELGTDDAKFFANTIVNADELLAYAMSSPTMMRWLKNMNANGTFMTLEQHQARGRAQENADTAMVAAEAQAPSMWQRLIDWLMKTLGVGAPFQAKFQSLMESASNQASIILKQGSAPDLYARLDALLQKTMEKQAAGPKELAPSSKSTVANATRQSVDETSNVVKGLSLPDFEPGNAFATRLKDWSGGWRNKPGMLGWLSLRQIADRFKDVPGVTKFAELSSRMGAKAKSLMAEAHAVDQHWAKLSNEETVELQKMMLESTMEQMWPDRALSADANNALDKTSSAVQAKHAALERRYKAMSDTQKLVFQNAQAKMRKDWDERGALLKSRIIDQYRPELESKFKGEKPDALANVNKADRADAVQGMSRNEKKSVQSMWDDIDQHATRLAQMQGPYFPLIRFGDHAVVAKSADFESQSEAFDKAKGELDALNSDDEATDEQLTAARAKVKTEQTALEDLKDSEKHYVVEFYESPSEAKAREAQLKAYFASKGTPMSVYSERRVEHFAKMDAVNPAFMKKLETTMSANLPDKDANAIRAAVRDLYIQSMPERSALKSQLRRLNVKGVKAGEMRRSFAAAAMRNSWHLSRLEFGAGMQQQLQDLRNGSSDDQRIVGGELAKRMLGSMQQDTSSMLVDRLSNLSYLTYLGMSPSFFIMNAAQPWVISLPIMAGRFGVKRATVELGKAFNETAAAMKSSAQDQKTWRFELDLEKFKDDGERAMLTELFNKGIIDVTIEHDLGSLASGQDTTKFGKMMQLATLPAHHTEVVNRVMTALAAYRLAMTPGMTGAVANKAEATKYAESVVADTHLDYTPENAPRFMRTASLGGMGRIIFQFKKYMQGMIYLLGKLSVDAARGDKEAGKGLVYLMGSQLAVAGASGLPIAAPLGMILAGVAKLWPDDDEPEIAQLFWNGVEDTVGAKMRQLLQKGIPAAALDTDVSGRLGMGSILNPVAFAGQGKEGKDWVASAALSLLGPSASMVANWADALTLAKSDPIKAMQTAMPKVLADPIRAMDRANRGVTNRKGVELISPDEFGPLSDAMRAIGFESTTVTDMYDKRSAFMAAKKGRDDARQVLIKEGLQDRAAASEDIAGFNERNPDNRITGATLLAAAKAKRTQMKEMRSGVQVKKQDKALASEYGLE
jgi:hypothetical protein